MIIALASPRPASSLEEGLEKIARFQSEATIYFASVNYALRFQESATSLIAPSGECQAYLPYGQEGVLVEEIDVAAATGLLARRYAPERYRELTAE
jgi:hypothetical protein